MFNPNQIPSYSHRDKMFGWLYESTIDLFKKTFNLNDEIVLLVTGSGTLANEVVIASCINTFFIKTEGQFSERLIAMNLNHVKYSKKYNSMGVQYETGSSKYYECEKIDFVDCISAFPYYKLPKDYLIATTSTFKQIGADTGLSVIILKDKKVLDVFEEEKQSYLSLKKYYNKSLTGFTPNTPAINAIKSLQDKLISFDLKKHQEAIDEKRLILEEKLSILGIEFYGVGPVFTIKKSFMNNELIKKYNLYINSGDVQLFLWSNTLQDIKNFLRDI
jgi:aspartate aminotransferase-like enzyme